MVAFRRDDFEDLMAFSAERVASYGSRGNNFQVQPVVIASCPVHKALANCWVVKKKGRDTYFSAFLGDAGETRVLLIFSSRAKAVSCLKNVGKQAGRYTITRFTWRGMVEKFGQAFGFAIVDEAGLGQGQNINILPIGSPFGT